MTLKQIDNLPILDAKKPVALIINENDIAKADRKEPMDCVVARACRRCLHVKEARVHLGRVYLKTNDGSWTRYNTPRALRSEIIAFDRGGSFSAGEFTLSPPSPSQRSGTRMGGAPKHKHARNNPKRKKRHAPHIVQDVRGGPAA